MYLKITLISFFYCIAHFVCAQTLNCYAKVTAIAGTTYSVSNVNETFDTFEDGEEIIIMQMQDNVIGANTLDDASFGNLSAIGSAGLYEVATILSHTESAGLPVTVTLNSATINTYNAGVNSTLQIISFRNMGTPANYTTTANITALPWNGNIGGVIALSVSGTLTLAHSINANASGFLGGSRSSDFYIGGFLCYNTPFRSSNNQDGFKGESIYKSTTTAHTNSRAKILNGGGGGVQINAGGGGGGNFTAGGIGGIGWNGSAAGCSFAAGGYGYGGIALSSVISQNRVFMGGGGGGGQQNDGLGSSGTNGGGIVLIRANQLITTGACGPLSISANGASAGNSGNDGAGGGGAAGSIVLNINSYTVAATCPLTVSANGGNGGTVNSTTHAGGGAGGQGFIVYSSARPTVNITTNTLNGSPGCNNNSVPCDNIAGSASGVNNSGIVASVLTPLPIDLIYFSANLCYRNVCLTWRTASESKNAFFTIEKSKDGIEFEIVAKINGAGNSSAILNYNYTDYKPYQGVSYYRLKQTDFNGSYSYSSLESVDFNKMEPFDFLIYPNKNKGDEINVEVSASKGEAITVSIIDALTKVCYETMLTIPLHGKNSFILKPSNQLPAGIYTVMAKSSSKVYNRKMIVE
jgi:hypothetical protein